MKTFDPYGILKVAKTATGEDIKKSYRTLSKENHPDKGGDQDKMAEISTAYSILSDPEKREKFDQTGEFESKPTFGQEVDSWVNKVLAQALQDKGVTYRNLIQKCEAIFKSEISQISSAIEQLEKYKKSLEEIRKKKCKKSADDSGEKQRRKSQFDYIVSQAIDQVSAQLKKLDHQQEVAEKAFDDLENLMSDDDERVFMPTWTFQFVSASNGWP